VSNRAYSLLELKSVDDDLRTIEGIATHVSPDRTEDIVEPKGALFSLPVPFMWQHGKNMPAIGHVTHAQVTDDGIRVKVQIESDDQPGPLKDHLDFAWRSIKKRLVRGLSIGFRPLESEQIKNSFGVHFKRWEWLELSAVTIPAHAEASITLIKQLDAQSHAETGEGARLHTPGDTGSRAVHYGRTKAPTMKTYQEQIAGLEATRQAKAAELEGIQSKAADEGRTKDQGERDSFNVLRDEIDGIDAELKDLVQLEKMNIQKAAPVQGKNVEDGSASRDGFSRVQMIEQLPMGIGFARAVKSTLVAKLDSRNPLDVAKQMYPSDARLHKHLSHVQMLPQIIMQLKAAVPAATMTDSTWAGALVDPTNLPGEFIEFLRPETIIGRLNLRGIPTNVRLIEQTQGGTGYWVGVGAPKPLTSFGYAPVTLSPTKVAAIAVATKESLRYSTPSLDMLIRDGLRDALVERVDIDLLDPAEAGSANVQPASLTNGLVALTSAGTSADHVRTDLANLVQALRSANLRGPIAIVLPDALLTALAFMVNSLGNAEFPGLDNNGGSYKGIRFIGSEYVANQSGSGNMVIAIAEREVFVSNDGGVTIDASDQASLQMLNNPTNNSATATPTTMVSMFQTNSVAFLGEWHINWQKRRSSAVAYMDDVNWGSVGSPA
jgi:HK97 family phage major capsid protein